MFDREARGRMRRLAGVCALLTLCLCVPALYLTARRAPRRETPTPVPAAWPAGAAVSGEDVFVLKDEDGRVAVYRMPELAAPEQVTQIRTSSLRAADQARLREGIAVLGWEALQMALEDFGP
ncbi:MAG: hypothetical protein LBH86_04465 [Oscillospiraceae bacterium]|jgi:hypothetical protein|nr:hypothetical protein [Oscillospiraceae bacterium]